MKWRGWYKLTEEGIEENASEKPGVYKIALPNRKAFKLSSPAKTGPGWYGIRKIGDIIFDKLKKNQPIRITEYEQEYFTDLAYIGKSREGIKGRLQKHLTDKESGVNKLLKCYKDLYYSYCETDDPDDAELKLYKDFVKATGPYKACPPCDLGSQECEEVGGESVPLYIKANKNLITIG